jgi:aryl sulfotransferase
MTVTERGNRREYRTFMTDTRRWDSFAARPDDVFVCTPAKCGTTWMQTIVATLLFGGDVPGPVMDVAPWLDARYEPIDSMIERLDAQVHRRSVKTHTNADGIPWYPTVSYIVVGRDGRDAFMSFHNHMAHMRPEFVLDLALSAQHDGIDIGDGSPPPVEDIHAFFAWWLNDEPMWFDHVASFWDHRDEPNVLFVHYNDMLEDLDREMRRVASFLNIEINESRWDDLVASCTFTAMKERADEIGDFSTGFVGGAETFLYRGSNARWRDVLTPEELAAFEHRSQELLPPDAIAWTTSGRTALPDAAANAGDSLPPSR